nr:hypothetical protein [uncultured Rhodoferax sp.]
MRLVGQIIFLSVLLCASGVIASLAFALGMLLFFLFTTTLQQTFVAHDITTLVYIWFVASLVAAPTALVVGVPAFFVLRRIGQFKWWSLAALGAIGGLAISQTSVGVGFPAVVFVGVGIVTSFTAWLLVVRSNISVESRPPMAAAHL